MSDSVVMDLFKTRDLVKICAPMVRYSKIQFRQLARNYGCDLCYTPMILADSFCKSDAARQNEFKTNGNDHPLIVQFAAKTDYDFVGAAHLVQPYSDGVELNCGCPQRWAIKDGYGCALLKTPEKIYDLVRSCRGRMPETYTVSVKIRVYDDVKKTITLCENLEKSGASYVVIHARTVQQRTEPIDTAQLTAVKHALHIPVVANGDVKTLNDAYTLQTITKCDGVMAARGMLSNPAMFDEKIRGVACDLIQKWVDICYNSIVDIPNWPCDRSTDDVVAAPFPQRHPNLYFTCFHHHLVFMLDKVLTRRQKRLFNNLNNFRDVLDFLRENFGVFPRLFDRSEYLNVKLSEVTFQNVEENDVYESLRGWESRDNVGKFFTDHVATSDDDDDDIGRLYVEN